MNYGEALEYYYRHTRQLGQASRVGNPQASAVVSAYRELKANPSSTEARGQFARAVSDWKVSRER